MIIIDGKVYTDEEFAAENPDQVSKTVTSDNTTRTINLNGGNYVHRINGDYVQGNVYGSDGKQKNKS